MDELSIDRALMWPTLASLLEERLADDPRATHAVIHSLNPGDVPIEQVPAFTHLRHWLFRRSG